MPVKINSTGGGSVTLDASSTASDFTATLPAGTGTIVVAGSSSALTSGTANTVSSTSVDYTGIPSWVKRITIMFRGVSTSGTSALRVQLGAGSVETSSYLGSTTVLATGVGTTQLSAGFDFSGEATLSANYTRHGTLVLSLIGSNVWVASGSIGLSDTTRTYLVNGSKSLSGTLDRVRITTGNGTDTFDAGTVNILYE